MRLQHGSSYGNVWVPQAGVIVRPGFGSEFRLSFSKGFRAPNLRELYLYPPHNPDLRPEYMFNYEVAYSQRLLEGRLKLGAALFFIDGKDMIQTVMIGGRPRKYLNVGRFINKGFEIEGAFRVNRLWAVAAAYSFLHTDAPVMQAPKHKLDASVSYSPGRFDFTLEDRSISGHVHRRARRQERELHAAKFPRGLHAGLTRPGNGFREGGQHRRPALRGHLRLPDARHYPDGRRGAEVLRACAPTVGML